MNASELKYQHELCNPNSHFFSRQTMKFFGDTMANYGCRWRGDLQAWELRRKKPVRQGLKSSAYFSPDIFRQVSMEYQVARQKHKARAGERRE